MFTYFQRAISFVYFVSLLGILLRSDNLSFGDYNGQMFQRFKTQKSNLIPLRMQLNTHKLACALLCISETSTFCQGFTWFKMKCQLVQRLNTSFIPDPMDPNLDLKSMKISAIYLPQEFGRRLYDCPKSYNWGFGGLRGKLWYSKYRYYSTPTNWSDAAQTCFKNGKLVEISTDDELEYLIGKVSNRSFFVGAHQIWSQDEETGPGDKVSQIGKWVWHQTLRSVDMSPWLWQEDRPTYDSENITSMTFNGVVMNKKLVDVPPGDLHPFVCECVSPLLP